MALARPRLGSLAQRPFVSLPPPLQLWGGGERGEGGRSFEMRGVWETSLGGGRCSVRLLSLPLSPSYHSGKGVVLDSLLRRGICRHRSGRLRFHQSGPSETATTKARSDSAALNLSTEPNLSRIQTRPADGELGRVMVHRWNGGGWSRLHTLSPGLRPTSRPPLARSF